MPEMARVWEGSGCGAGRSRRWAETRRLGCEDLPPLLACCDAARTLLRRLDKGSVSKREHNASRPAVGAGDRDAALACGSRAAGKRAACDTSRCCWPAAHARVAAVLLYYCTGHIIASQQPCAGHGQATLADARRTWADVAARVSSRESSEPAPRPIQSPPAAPTYRVL